MIHDFHPQPTVSLPQWANTLVNYYWHIRVEGRDKTKRRYYYRLVRKERLRLVEQFALEQQLVDATCRYLANFNRIAADRLQCLLIQQPIQLKLNFKLTEGK